MVSVDTLIEKLTPIIKGLELEGAACTQAAPFVAGSGGCD